MVGSTATRSVRTANRDTRGVMRSSQPFMLHLMMFLSVGSTRKVPRAAPCKAARKLRGAIPRNFSEIARNFSKSRSRHYL